MAAGAWQLIYNNKHTQKETSPKKVIGNESIKSLAHAIIFPINGMLYQAHPTLVETSLAGQRQRAIQ